MATTTLTTTSDTYVDSAFPDLARYTDYIFGSERLICTRFGSICNILLYYHIPPNITITSSVLTYQKFFNPVVSHAKMYGLDQSYEPSTATWNKYDGTNSWSTLGGPYTTGNFLGDITQGAGSHAVVSNTLTANTYLNEISSGARPNYGFIIPGVSTELNGEVDMWSSRENGAYGVTDTTAPFLTLTYTVNPLPNPYLRFGDSTFIVGDSSVTFKPDFRYTSSISLPLHKCKLSNGKQDIWDDGAGYDIRSVSLTTQMDESDTSSMSYLFQNTGRSLDLVLITDDGFYPFGADLGQGDFTCAMTKFSVSGKSDLPYKYHEVSLDLTLKSGPSYSYTAPTTEGTFAIGDASNLMMPQQLFQPLIDMDNNFSVTRNGSVNYADRRSEAVSSKFKVQACPANTARLLHQITSHIRGNSFSIANYNAVAPWAPGNVMLDNFKINITHDSPNRMTTSLEVIRV